LFTSFRSLNIIWENTGYVSLYAGGDQYNGGCDDGYLTNARFLWPGSIEIVEPESPSDQDKIFVGDEGCHKIKQIRAGQVSNVAGTGLPGTDDGLADCPGLDCLATLWHVYGLAFDSDENLYFGDQQSIRRKSTNDNLMTIAGHSYAGWPLFWDCEDGEMHGECYDMSACEIYPGPGNTVCSENYECSCPSGICESWETVESCYEDCAECGDDICDPNLGETFLTCPEDCQRVFISYNSLETGTDTLKYTVCSDPECNNILTQKTFDTEHSRISSMELNNGYPNIAYQGSSIVAGGNGSGLRYHLSFAVCNNELCDNPTFTDFPNELDAIPVTHIGADGYPIIVFSTWPEFANQELEVLKCGNANCNSANNVFTWLFGRMWFTFDSAIDSNGLLSIIHTDDMSLNYIKCSNPACTSKTEKPFLNHNVDLGDYISIDLDSANIPVIVYNQFNAGFELIQCFDPLCTGSEIQLTLSDYYTDRDAVNFDSNDNPVLIYSKQNSHELYLHKCGNTCSVADSIITPLPITGQDPRPSLSLDANDNPIISYFHSPDKDLYVIRCHDPVCSSYTNTLVESNGVVGDYSSLQTTY